ALAAGCSVVVKAHSGHMATADFVAQAIERGVEKSNMPKGVFNMIYGNGVGEPLVKHPLIQAVGFTGSLRGGRALCDMAAARPQPIPVFAESAILIAIGWRLIWKREINKHKNVMLAAAVFALTFFLIYASRTIFIGNTAFGGPASIKKYYTIFLFFHINLATIGGILGLVQIITAFKDKYN
ncbi:aldehyde dehydrogenase family protein, partial [Acinetobacter baumannii]|uniref:aldehyde dehydrogenase family protein n=1 Tax=Acinetobacter baumannii TaxID=470 RepID=UPI003EDA49BC